MLVKYDATDTRNCAVVNGDKKCKADEDGSGGFVVAVISDAPVGHPLPATDTLPVEQAAPSDDGLWLLIQGLAGAAALALFLARPARRGSR